MFDFKVGDKVYYPMATNEVLQVSSSSHVYYVGTDNNINSAVLSSGGRWFEFHHNPAFFPATQEWYDKLVHVYPDLERPPNRKEPKKVIGLMKEAGHKFILCKAKGHSSDQWETVVAFDVSSYRAPTDSFDYISDSFGSLYSEFYPINSRGQKIVDFVDGEVVLED